MTILNSDYNHCGRRCIIAAESFSDSYYFPEHGR